MFILCTCINSTNFDETLLLAILSKFKLTSLEVRNGDEDIFMSLLQMASIQETLEHFKIKHLHISKLASVLYLLDEFNRINSIRIIWKYYEDDKLEKLRPEVLQIIRKLRKKQLKFKIRFDLSER